MGLGIKEIIGDKRDAILAAAAKYGIENVRIFGSVARGDATENSDVDFIAKVAHLRWSDYLDFCENLEAITQKKVEVLSEGAIDYEFGNYIKDDVVVL